MRPAGAWKERPAAAVAAPGPHGDRQYPESKGDPKPNGHRAEVERQAVVATFRILKALSTITSEPVRK